MPESGRGFDESAKGTWRAGKDFKFRNLQVRKDEALPTNWQFHPLIRWLKTNHGEDSVYWATRYPKVTQKTAEPDTEDFEPVGAAVIGKRKKK